MTAARPFAPARLFVAAAGDLDEARHWLDREFGPTVLESEIYDLVEFTDYYVPEMGRPQWKRFFAFSRPIDPGMLASIKIKTNGKEAESHPRRLNLDPGYVTPANIVLASAKNFAHRVALAEGIYAEVTLVFRRDSKSFLALDHTFPDYRQKGVIRFFNRLRDMP